MAREPPCDGRIQDRDVDRFVAKLARLRPAISAAEVQPFLVGFVVHPRARVRGRETGVLVLATYDR